MPRQRGGELRRQNRAALTYATDAMNDSHTGASPRPSHRPALAVRFTSCFRGEDALDPAEVAEVGTKDRAAELRS
jgi:hypothetical protein